MLEPVIPLVFRTRLGLGPGAIGTLFGIAAVASTAMHPIYGRLSDRFGGRRLMMIGLVGSALLLPLLSVATDFRSAAFAMVPMWMVFSMIVTPSLAYMAEAASAAGFESYGVVYGVYNMAWAVGLMVSPALGGFLLERIGFEALTVSWGLFLLVIGLILARTMKTLERVALRCTALHILTHACFRYRSCRTDRPSDTTMGANGQSDAAANSTYTKFVFVLPSQDDAATLTKIRAAGSNISRGFFNDYDADGSRDPSRRRRSSFSRPTRPAWAARGSAPRASLRTCRRTIARGWTRSSAN